MAGKKDYQVSVQTFEIIYGLYQKPIERYLMMRINNQEFASELCQETFERFWKFLLSQETASQQTAYYKNWLYRTATNLAIDEHRHNKLINFLPMPESETYAPFAELMVEGDEDRILERLWLQETVPQLPQQYRVSLLAKHYWGYSQKEIASKFGIAESTVSANVARGKTHLRRKYFPVMVDFHSQRVDALYFTGLIDRNLELLRADLRAEKLDFRNFKEFHRVVSNAVYFLKTFGFDTPDTKKDVGASWGNKAIEGGTIYRKLLEGIIVDQVKIIW